MSASTTRPPLPPTAPERITEPQAQRVLNGQRSAVVIEAAERSGAWRRDNPVIEGCPIRFATPGRAYPAGQP